MAISSYERRRLQRLTEAAMLDPAASSALEVEGITLGEPIRLSAEEFEAAVEDERAAHRVTVRVTVFFHDTPVETRSVIEDPLADFLELNDIGEWVGAGQGSVDGEEQYFVLSFAVNDLSLALPVIERKLRELGAGPDTELHTSNGTHKLGSAA